MSRKEWVLIVVAGVCILVASLQASLPYAVWLTVVGVLVGVLVGGAITALFSWYFYQQAGDELRKEAAELRHYVNALISYLEAQGYIPEVRYDEEYRPQETKILRPGSITPPEQPPPSAAVQSDPPEESQDRDNTP